MKRSPEVYGTLSKVIECFTVSPSSDFASFSLKALVYLDLDSTKLYDQVKFRAQHLQDNLMVGSMSNVRFSQISRCLTCLGLELLRLIV